MRKGFLQLYRTVWDSPEYRALSVAAQVVLTDMWTRALPTNKGVIIYGYRDAMARGIPRRNTTRIFNELRSSSLVEVATPASFDNKSGAAKGIATTWRLKFIGRK